MLVEIKELCCSSNYDNNGYVDEEDTVFINPNPEFDYDYNFVDIETHIEVREIEKVYQVHTLGCSREEVIVIDEAAMTLLRELV
jgi:hypothetical protein